MKTHRKLKIVGIVLASVMLFMTIINIIPPTKNVDNNPFMVDVGELPMIAAHRGGGACNPENTLLAFKEAVNTYGAQIIETDVYMTKDGYLVFNHDAYVDLTCNINGDITLDEVKELCKDEANRHYIKDMTLSELRQYNFGYYFENEEGTRIYRDESDPESLGIQIPMFDELFSMFYETNPKLLFIVEIKDSGELGYEACKVLYESMQRYPEYAERIVVGTFHSEVENELKTKYPSLYRGAPTSTAAKFILSQMFRVNLFYFGDFSCLQIPTSYDVGININLKKNNLIKRAHRRNIAVQYWTVNDEETMRELIELGCDAIMTDNPELLRSVLLEYVQPEDTESEEQQ